jgi:hypothetical protein
MLAGNAMDGFARDAAIVGQHVSEREAAAEERNRTGRTRSRNFYPLHVWRGRRRVLSFYLVMEFAMPGSFDLLDAGVEL